MRAATGKTRIWFEGILYATDFPSSSAYASCPVLTVRSN
jgi:hypothetical protein